MLLLLFRIFFRIFRSILLNALFGIFAGCLVVVLSFLVYLLDDVNIDVSY